MITIQHGAFLHNTPQLKDHKSLIKSFPRLYIAQYLTFKDSSKLLSYYHSSRSVIIKLQLKIFIARYFTMQPE